MAILSSPLQYISSTPPATRSFSALLVFISGCYYWLQWRQPETSLVPANQSFPYLTLVPGLSWVYPWTLLTSSFVEKTVIEVCGFKDPKSNAADVPTPAHLFLDLVTPFVTVSRTPMGNP